MIQVNPLEIEMLRGLCEKTCEVICGISGRLIASSGLESKTENLQALCYWFC